MSQDTNGISSATPVFIAPPGWVDRDEASRMLGISRTQWKHWCRNGHVQGGKWVARRPKGRCKIYPIEDIQRLAEQEASRPLVLKQTLEAGDLTPAEGYITREEACKFFGVGKTSWKRWERAGHLPRGEWARGLRARPWQRVYPLEELKQIWERFTTKAEPYPDPQRTGCYRVPVMSFHTTRCEAIIDADDLPKVQGKRWNWHDRGDQYDGAVALADHELDAVPLKFIIVGRPSTQCRIRHRNGDPLDCRRMNLIVLTRSDHGIGARKKQMHKGQPCTSRFKGVCLDDRGTWRVMIKKKGNKPRFVGRFSDEIEAAQAYDEAARELFGEHARLNFPDNADEQGQSRQAA